LIWNGCFFSVMIRVSLFIFLVNDTDNHISLVLIMISELWSQLQKMKIKLPWP
jgi:hypothetical protein